MTTTPEQLEQLALKALPPLMYEDEGKVNYDRNIFNRLYWKMGYQACQPTPPNELTTEELTLIVKHRIAALPENEKKAIRKILKLPAKSAIKWEDEMAVKDMAKALSAKWGVDDKGKDVLSAIQDGICVGWQKWLDKLPVQPVSKDSEATIPDIKGYEEYVERIEKLMEDYEGKELSAAIVSEIIEPLKTGAKDYWNALQEKHEDLRKLVKENSELKKGKDSAKVDWEAFEKKFFDECTIPVFLYDDTNEATSEISLQPRELFNWFKSEIENISPAIEPPKEPDERLFYRQ